MRAARRRRRRTRRAPAGLAGGPRLLAYVPSEAHSCVPRALELLGLGSDRSGRCRCRRAPRRGRAARRDRGRPRGGRDAALLVGSAGTVNTGAIDPLEALADVAAAEGLWFHVDGAYGAFGVLDPALAARYRGMERADSLTLDPHKWLGVPVDAGCALVRRADDLRDAFSLVPPYLRQDAGAEVGTFAEYGLEQTRPFRALKTWATIAARGRAGIVDQVVRANALARELAALVEREPSLELAAAPETSIVAFRARPPAARRTARGRQPRAARGRPGARAAFVTGTVYEGRETCAPASCTRARPRPTWSSSSPRCSPPPTTLRQPTAPEASPEALPAPRQRACRPNDASVPLLGPEAGQDRAPLTQSRSPDVLSETDPPGGDVERDGHIEMGVLG